MKARWLPVLLILGALIVAPGCAPVADICTASELSAANLVAPPFWGTVASLTPTLVWDYSSGPYDYLYPSPYVYGGTNGCVPEMFRVTLRTGPFFTDDLGGFTANGSTTLWTVSTPLQPGTEYAWGIQAMTDGVYGPYAGYSYFFTGPTCETSALVAPVLLEPANGAVISDLWPSLIWDYPEDCSPEGYRVDLSTTADFSDTSLSGGTGNPSTRWGAGHTLDDCETYYWKVTAINDITLGPESVTFSFKIDASGSCLYPFPYDWPIFHLAMNAACRVGPTLDYNIMEYLETGDNHPAEGRNEDGSWLLLRLDETRLCWVAQTTGMLDDDVMKLPHVIPPQLTLPDPTDTPTPVPQVNCSLYKDYNSCAAHQDVCTWIWTQTGVGYCKNK